MKMNRDKVICRLYKDGMDMSVIAGQYGVSKQRVHQIIKKNGLSGSDGGKSVSVKLALIASKQEADKLYLERYGCKKETYIQIRGLLDSNGNTPQRCFRQQRNAAKTRGIMWRLSFFQWWVIWTISGKWKDRGVGSGKYCMCRYGDTGVYSKENVYIDLHPNNVSDGFLIKRNKKGD